MRAKGNKVRSRTSDARVRASIDDGEYQPRVCVGAKKRGDNE